MNVAEEWTVREQGDADEFCLCIDQGEKWLISFRQNGEMLVERQREIAALISAVPTMLDALTAMRDTLRLLQPALNLMARDVVDDIIKDQIDPALAKAGVRI